MMIDSNTEHKAYKRFRYSRKLCRDSAEGSDSIKRGNEIYLPMPTGFAYRDSIIDSNSANKEASDGLSATDFPWYHTNKAYSSYLQRAKYAELVSIARNGLVGIATNKKPTLKLPSKISYLEENIGGQGETVYDFLAELILETLTVGNAGIFVDVNVVTNKLFFNVVPCEDSIDWEEKSSDDSTTFLNIRRKTAERLGKFEKEEVIYNFVYELTKDSKPKAVLQKYKDGMEDGAPVELNLQGYAFDSIPVFPVGCQKNSFCPQTSPMKGLSEICLSIYRKDADLSNAQYMTCNPNLTITGADSEIDDEGNETGIPHIVGSQVALIIPNPDAKVFYPNTDTSALEHCRTAIQDLYSEAVMYSISLVGQEKKSAEAEGTVELRQNAHNATLVNVVYNCSSALRNALKFAARISGADENAVELVVSTDFSKKTISAQLLSALVSAWVARGLSLDTLLRNFKDAGIIPKDSSVEEEIVKIQNEVPQA
jgi:hypothetical protein